VALFSKRVIDSPMLHKIRKQEQAPASSTPIERSPSRAARPTRARRSRVEFMPGNTLSFYPPWEAGEYDT